MCGRFAQIRDEEELMKSLSVHSCDVNVETSYNIAPGAEISIVHQHEGRRLLDSRKWGLIPFWAKEGGRGMINARSETVSEKPSFRHAFSKRRCLIPASGFYEWNKTEQGKQPWFISGRSDPLVFAGIWEQWRSPEEIFLKSCAILTCEANELMAPIHHRMPVILDEKGRNTWLDPNPPEHLKMLLKPCTSDLLQAWPVSPQVNHPVFNGPECFEPVIS